MPAVNPKPLLCSLLCYVSSQRHFCLFFFCFFAHWHCQQHLADPLRQHDAWHKGYLTVVSRQLLCRPDLTHDEKESTIEELVREVTALWQTDELRRQKPSALDGALMPGLKCACSMPYNILGVRVGRGERGLLPWSLSLRVAHGSTNIDNLMSAARSNFSSPNLPFVLDSFCQCMLQHKLLSVSRTKVLMPTSLHIGIVACPQCSTNNHSRTLHCLCQEFCL